MKIAQKVISICIAGLLLLCASATVQAQQAPGPAPKWLQPPDLTPMGLDVSAMAPIILADDFLCTSTGPITNIQIWGSWLGDYLPNGNDPTDISFRLKIHPDIPNPYPDNPQYWSTPAEPILWERMFYSANHPTTFTVEPYYTLPDEPEGEGWYDPFSPPYIPDADHTIWQYNFDIPLPEAFVQQGTTGNPITYWLSLEAFVQDPDAHFGWKTSSQHWNDDAVWMSEASIFDPDFSYITNGGTISLWSELLYPDGHELVGQSIDLAFAIAPEPITLAVLILGMVPAALRKHQRSH